jgi:hypothetical protein
MTCIKSKPFYALGAAAILVFTSSTFAANSLIHSGCRSYRSPATSW